MRYLKTSILWAVLGVVLFGATALAGTRLAVVAKGPEYYQPILTSSDPSQQLDELAAITKVLRPQGNLTVADVKKLGYFIHNAQSLDSRGNSVLALEGSPNNNSSSYTPEQIAAMNSQILAGYERLKEPVPNPTPVVDPNMNPSNLGETSDPSGQIHISPNAFVSRQVLDNTLAHEFSHYTQMKENLPSGSQVQRPATGIIFSLKVTAFDPSEATSAAIRQEMGKISGAQNSGDLNAAVAALAALPGVLLTIGLTFPSKKTIQLARIDDAKQELKAIDDSYKILAAAGEPIVPNSPADQINRNYKAYNQQIIAQADQALSGSRLA